jgi:hypothetical protein
MKKTSTIRVNGNMIFKGHKLTIGLDLGDRSSHYCVLDEAGEVLLEQKLATTPEAMKQTFERIPRSLIALETGTHSPWLSRLLKELGHAVLVAHAQKVELISKSNRKDDRHDARTLARLARIDPELLGPVRHRSAKAQIHLTVIRARAELVSARTALVNAARGLTKSCGERLPKCGTEQVSRELATKLSAELREVLEPLLREIESLNERIKPPRRHRPPRRKHHLLFPHRHLPPPQRSSLFPSLALLSLPTLTTQRHAIQEGKAGRNAPGLLLLLLEPQILYPRSAARLLRYCLLCSGLLGCGASGCGALSCCGAGGRFECVPVAFVAFACEPFCMLFPVFALPEDFVFGFAPAAP